MLPEIRDAKEFSYDAFISYSRRDKAFATVLQAALQGYRPPKSLGLSHRHLRVFRDEQDFTGSGYTSSLEKSLNASTKLLVICSPAARQSTFVNDEIRRFVKVRGADHIIPILLSGIPNNEARLRPTTVVSELGNGTSPKERLLGHGTRP
jgi:hypothetical protein